MKATTVKYFCDLCGKKIERVHYLAWFIGSALKTGTLRKENGNEQKS